MGCLNVFWPVFAASVFSSVSCRGLISSLNRPIVKLAVVEVCPEARSCLLVLVRARVPCAFGTGGLPSHPLVGVR